MAFRACPPLSPHAESAVTARLGEITDALQQRFYDLAERLPRGWLLPAHDVAFSRRVTMSWALIYYRRNAIRLSPYVFLLDRDELSTGSHWQELDATLRHELAHAYLYHFHGEKGHSAEFGDVLRCLGVEPNGGCDVGPPNPTHRYAYACPACGNEWLRRSRLTGDWSCGKCSPGVFDPRYRMSLDRELPDPWARLAEREDVMRACLREAASTRRLLPRAAPPPAWAALVGGEPAASKRGRPPSPSGRGKPTRGR